MEHVEIITIETKGSKKAHAADRVGATAVCSTRSIAAAVARTIR